MAELKHILEIRRNVRAMAPDAGVECERRHSHIRLGVTVNGTHKRFTVACSPSQPEHAIRNTTRDIAKAFNLTTTTK